MGASLARPRREDPSCLKGLGAGAGDSGDGTECSKWRDPASWRLVPVPHNRPSIPQPLKRSIQARVEISISCLTLSGPNCEGSRGVMRSCRIEIGFFRVESVGLRFPEGKVGDFPFREAPRFRIRSRWGENSVVYGSKPATARCGRLLMSGVFGKIRSYGASLRVLAGPRGSF